MTNIDVRDFWDAAACGEAAYAVGGTSADRFAAQRETRYKLEPFIAPFANFVAATNRDVLEIGVGMGADHEQWARKSPRKLCGIDLTPHGIDLTSERLSLYGLSSELQVADAEALPFPDANFDIVYSWGVLHHSNDTQQAINEVARVLRPKGQARIMIYHRYSFVGALLWLRYGRFCRSLTSVYAEHLESPGTKAYSYVEAKAMIENSGLEVVAMHTELSPGDLLTGDAGQRHKGAALSILRKIWPRKTIRTMGRRLGLFLLIEAEKP
ncbi:class I SAM-dependent methyltransferase [Tardiphaga sp.]|uniref:class I SAM-dependent methyltransferase n=1 Tax=Tardiphaga sp. TaxID=1926292 RepID=UPI0037DA528E